MGRPGTIRINQLNKIQLNTDSLYSKKYHRPKKYHSITIFMINTWILDRIGSEENQRTNLMFDYIFERYFNIFLRKSWGSDLILWKIEKLYLVSFFFLFTPRQQKGPLCNFQFCHYPMSPYVPSNNIFAFVILMICFLFYRGK